MHSVNNNTVELNGDLTVAGRATVNALTVQQTTTVLNNLTVGGNFLPVVGAVTLNVAASTGSVAVYDANNNLLGYLALFAAGA